MSFRDTKAGDLTADDAGRSVQLAGWVDRVRDQGGVVFVDLRDASGIVQIVIDPGSHPAAVELRREFCLSITGPVSMRPEGSENPDLPTGQIEVSAEAFDVLSTAQALPFQLDERTEVDELVRLKYRYLDMRRPRVAANLRARSVGVAAMRRVLGEAGFLEVETPTLIKSTPEGARDVLVPSRLQQGDFYALPQSPQLFKQLLMIGGIERYYQIARCYRDEDFRSDRQLEFTQLDIEGSFWGRDDVLATIEDVIVAVVRDVRGVEVDAPFPRITYQESMARYGRDKPDTRFEMLIEDLTDLFSTTEFKAFAGAVEAGGVI
ncbi:MAG: aspartate--tRNA ligase, partial [Acidimicrobiia bacterium]|nr:aspartate--tRNA ligase [Acidimicrobiia bacterium]